MQLYTLPQSSNSIKVSALVNLLNLRLEIIPVDFRGGFHKSPEYLRINPNGTMPTLLDGEFCLWESNAILVYLANQAPGQTVFPADPQGQADVLRWLFWSAAQLGPPSRVYVLERTVKPVLGQSSDETKIGEAEPELLKAAKVLEGHLSSSQYLVGEGLTLADLAVAAALMKWQLAGMPIENCSHLLAWLPRITQLPAWKSALP